MVEIDTRAKKYPPRMKSEVLLVEITEMLSQGEREESITGYIAIAICCVGILCRVIVERILVLSAPLLLNVDFDLVR